MDICADVLPSKESMRVEFKSDRSSFPDSDLTEALICLANSEGGDLWLGVEDDGVPSGLHANHRNLRALPALIASRTSPPLLISVSKHIFAGVEVAKITVPQCKIPIGTMDGLYLRRRLKSDGTPECVSMQ